MRKHALAFILTLVTTNPASADDEPPSVIFSPKIFYNNGNIVHVEGTLAGSGIGYKNNSSAITCYQKRQECIAIHIEAEGAQVLSVGLPVSFAVRLWSADRIVADSPTLCGGLKTWTINLTQQAAELIENPCQGGKIYHWTIEDPPFWKKANEGLGDRPPPR
jgi:hypothetical protein